MVEAWTTTRETVRDALDVAENLRDNTSIDRAIASATRTVEGRLHRRFYPFEGVRYFDWPNASSRSSFRLWLDDNDLISASSIVSGGVALTPDQYLLRRSDSHPDGPFTHVEINLGTSGAFSAGITTQEAIAITGVWGFTDDEEQIGELSAPLAASASATAQITWSTMDFGVGTILRIGTERMIVRGRTMIDTTQNLAVALDEDLNGTTVAVADGTAFAPDEILLVDAERMRVNDIAGNNLIVTRAYDGTALAAHLFGADVYALTGATLARAQLGTAIAAHSASDAVYRHLVPSLIGELTVAYAENDLLQRRSGYSRTVGSGDNERESSGRGLTQILRDAQAAYGRKLRHRAV